MCSFYAKFFHKYVITVEYYHHRILAARLKSNKATKIATLVLGSPWPLPIHSSPPAPPVPHAARPARRPSAHSCSLPHPVAPGHPPPCSSHLWSLLCTHLQWEAGRATQHAMNAACHEGKQTKLHYFSQTVCGTLPGHPTVHICHTSSTHISHLSHLQYTCMMYPMRTPGLSGPGLSGPGLSGPGLSGPGLSEPGLSGPGLSGSGLSGPGLSGPGLSGPGLSGSGLSGPGLSGPGFPKMAFEFKREQWALGAQSGLWGAHLQNPLGFTTSHTHLTQVVPSPLTQVGGPQPPHPGGPQPPHPGGPQPPYPGGPRPPHPGGRSPAPSPRWAVPSPLTQVGPPDFQK